AVSPDGKTAVSGSLDNTVRVWDMMTGECILTIQGNGAILSACITSSGIVAGDIGGSVLLFSRENLPAGNPVVTARKKQGKHSVRCLHCYRFFEPDYGDLGQEVSCPLCGGVLKLNSFVVEDLVFKRSLFGGLKRLFER
ncbi:MAG: hypothetical protein JXA44_11825, partial [Methanospirillaceae archaeon]|nr:hypothetical protein [Methanospirillaceae archaeon]